MKSCFDSTLMYRLLLWRSYVCSLCCKNFLSFVLFYGTYIDSMVLHVGVSAPFVSKQTCCGLAFCLNNIEIPGCFFWCRWICIYSFLLTTLYDSCWSCRYCHCGLTSPNFWRALPRYRTLGTHYCLSTYRYHKESRFLGIRPALFPLVPRCCRMEDPPRYRPLLRDSLTHFRR